MIYFKGDLALSEQFYKASLNIQPMRGDIWNQLGLMSNLK